MAAHAGVRDEVATLASDGAQFVIVCTSARQVGQAVQRIVEQADAAAPIPPELASLFGQDGVLTPDSGLRMALWGVGTKGSLLAPAPEPFVIVSFDTAMELDPLAERLATELDYTVVPQGEERLLRANASGKDELLLGVAGGRATFRSTGSKPAPDQPIDARLIERVPDEDGCALIGRAPGRPKGEPAEPSALPKTPDFAGSFSLHVPFTRGEPVRFAVVVEGDGGDPPHVASARPPVTTADAPLAVLRVGVELDSADLSEFGETPAQARAARWVQRHLPLDGATVAAFLPGPGSRGPRFAADLPFTRGWSPAKSARKARKVVKKVAREGPMQIVKRDATSFDLVGPRTITVVGVEGGVRVATDPTLLADMAERRGDAWLDGEMAARSADRHVFVLLDMAQLPMLMAPPEALVTVGLTFGAGGLAEGELYVPMSLDELLAWSNRLQAMRNLPGLGKPKR